MRLVDLPDLGDKDMVSMPALRDIPHSLCRSRASVEYVRRDGTQCWTSPKMALGIVSLML